MAQLIVYCISVQYKHGELNHNCCEMHSFSENQLAALVEKTPLGKKTVHVKGIRWNWYGLSHDRDCDLGLIARTLFLRTVLFCSKWNSGCECFKTKKISHDHKITWKIMLFLIRCVAKCNNPYDSFVSLLTLIGNCRLNSDHFLVGNSSVALFQLLIKITDFRINRSISFSNNKISSPLRRFDLSDAPEVYTDVPESIACWFFQLQSDDCLAIRNSTGCHQCPKTRYVLCEWISSTLVISGTFFVNSPRASINYVGSVSLDPLRVPFNGNLL